MDDRKKIELKNEFQVICKPPNKGQKFLAMAGWHNNYFDFTRGRTKGTVLLVGTNLNLLINNEYSFTIPVEQVIKFCIREMLKHKRAKK